MNPNTRRALHQALDIVLDAMSEDKTSVVAKKSRRRGPVQPEPPPRPEVSPEVTEKVRAQLERAGYRKAG